MLIQNIFYVVPMQKDSKKEVVEFGLPYESGIPCEEIFLPYVAHLLELGADINSQSNAGKTALFRAAEYGHAKLIRLLLSKGADPYIPARSGLYPIHAAAEGGLIKAVKEFEAQGVSLSLATSTGWTPAHCAAVNGNISLLKYLCKRGVNLQKKNKQGITPFVAAASSSDPTGVLKKTTKYLSRIFKLKPQPDEFFLHENQAGNCQALSSNWETLLSFLRGTHQRKEIIPWIVELYLVKLYQEQIDSLRKMSTSHWEQVVRILVEFRNVDTREVFSILYRLCSCFRTHKVCS